MENRIKVMIFEPKQEAYPTNIRNDIFAYSKAVGGPITAKMVDDNTVIIYNDTKSEINVNPNRWVGKAIINGTFILAGYSDSGEFVDMKPEQMQYYRAAYAKQEIDKDSYLARIRWTSNEIGLNEVYKNNLNFEFGRNKPDFKAIAESLKNGDMAEAKEFLKKLHDQFVNAFGTDNADDLKSRVEYASLPIVKKYDTGGLQIGLVEINLKDSEECWDNTHFTDTGCITPKDMDKNPEIRKCFTALGPYHYWFTPVYNCEFYEHNSNAPEDVLELLNYVRGLEEQIQEMNMEM